MNDTITNRIGLVKVLLKIISLKDKKGEELKRNSYAMVFSLRISYQIFLKECKMFSMKVINNEKSRCSSKYIFPLSMTDFGVFHSFSSDGFPP